MYHLIRRLSFYMLALWVAATLNFILPRLAPGNPAQALMARMHGRIAPQALRSLEIAYGISHEPLWVQYVQYLGNLLRGDLGISISYFPMRVTEVIAQNLPWTLVLIGVSLIVSFVLGTMIGIITAWWRGTIADTILPPFFIFLSGIPYFWLALMLLYVLAFTYNMFPINGGYDIHNTIPGWNLDFILSASYHALLPAITIIISSVGGWVLGMRNSMIMTLSEDYVILAEAKGLSQAAIMFRYAARNAILPNITSFALSLGFVVSGSLLTEIVFSYPGIGYGLYQAMGSKDYALLQGVFFFIALAVLAANFFADLLYVILDPRVRHR